MILDISRYRVRKLPPRTSEFAAGLIEVRHETEIDSHKGWSNIATFSLAGTGSQFQGKFEERNRLNVPGPFYGAMTDTCGTGPIEAPQSVMIDSDGQEFVFLQPTSADQMRQLIGAAYVDPFEGYGADGDEHWTLGRIREWWRTRHALIALETGLQLYNSDIAHWRRLISGDYEQYLRQYAFFVEERRLPSSADSLPLL